MSERDSNMSQVRKMSIPPLMPTNKATDDEYFVSLLRDSTTATHVRHTLFQLDQRAETITSFIDLYGNKTKLVRLDVTDALKTPRGLRKTNEVNIYEIHRNGSTFRVAKGFTSVALLKNGVSDLETKSVAVHCIIIGVPYHLGSTIGQMDFNDIEYAACCFAADALAPFYEVLSEGKKLFKNTLN